MATMPEIDPASQWLRRFLPGVALLSTLLASSACTLLSDLAVHQCETTADCDTLDDGIQRCNDGTCVAGCENNRHCATFDLRKPICPTTGDQCVALTSEDGSCQVSTTYDDETMGEATGVDLTIVGTFGPSFESSAWLTLELAADEINATVPQFSEVLTPTLVAQCQGSAALVGQSMNHLVNQLRITAVIASLETRPLQIVTQTSDLAREALLLSPDGAAYEPSGDGADLLWYLGGRYEDVLERYPPLLRGLAASLEPQLGSERPLRIASLSSAASEDAALAQRVADSISLDGRDADYLFREDRFRRFTLVDESADERALTLTQLTDYAPDIVLVFLGGAFDEPQALPRLSVLQTLEERASSTPDWSPFFILGPRALDDSAVLLVAASSDRFRRRTIGVGVGRAPDPRLSGELQSRFAAAFPEAVTGGLSASLNTYDALYYLTYASAVARQRGEITAENMLDGLARITDFRGECVDVGRDGVSAAVELITSDRAFQLCGTTGSARFTADHARGGQSRLVCWSVDASESMTSSVRLLDDPYALLGAISDPGACAQDFVPLEGAP
jgi:hypothetical protein